MRAVKISIGVAVLAGITLLLISLEIAPVKGPAFWTSLLVNLVAGFTGLAIGMFLTVIIASSFAKEKLGKLAPRLVELITQLREDKTISGLAARCAVVCSVALMSEDHLRSKRSKSDDESARGTKHCAVCALDSLTTPDGRDGIRC